MSKAQQRQKQEEEVDSTVRAAASLQLFGLSDAPSGDLGKSCVHHCLSVDCLLFIVVSFPS